MKTDPGYALINQVLATSSVMVKESHRIFRPHGLTDAQFNVLNVLGPNPAGLSQRELSDVLIVDRSNITNMLDRMEHNGWVKRSDHPADRRVYIVTLTPEGRRLWQKVRPEYLAAVAAVTEAFTEADMRRTHEFLHRLELSVRAWGASRAS